MGTTFNFPGSVAVVTGASSGLGRRIAQDMAVRGATVIGVARREGLLQQVAAEMRRSSPTSGYVACDVSDTDRFASVLSDLEGAHGRIDLLINDAGIGEPDGENIDKYRTIFETNFFAAVAGTLAVLPGMVERSSGVIVNVSSDTGRAPGPGEPAYSASKAALSAFTESLSYTVDDRGVRLHVLYPGYVSMPMTEGSNPTKVPRFVRRTEHQVSQTLLRGLGRPRVEIDATRVARLAPVARALVPGAYRRGVKSFTPS
ncbi:MAG TPA: SDR family oxidoreductase [Acidimicrobiia bacterium]|nr:SDR family oxidoreductase [Acidimicrobiia bacterium]